MRANYDASASVLLVLDTVRLDNLSLRREKLKAGRMFKTLNGNMPYYLQHLFSVAGTGYNMRSFDAYGGICPSHEQTI